MIILLGETNFIPSKETGPCMTMGQCRNQMPRWPPSFNPLNDKI